MSEVVAMSRCLQCAGELVSNRQGGFVCKYCGTVYHGKIEGYNEEIKELISLRQMREFIKAEEICEELLRTQRENSEAHWQMLLIKYGVVYVEEEGKYKPTFFSYPGSDHHSILKDEHYLSACKYATNDDDLRRYQEKGAELDALLKAFFELMKKEKPYDIFISFKKSEMVLSDGREKMVDTDEYRKAYEIYDYLKDKYNVFFSPVSIGKDTGIEGEKYEPRILKALNTSMVMILVGFSEKNITAQWVQNEWRRYLYQIDKKAKASNSLIYVFEKHMWLPGALANRQMPNIDCYDGKYLEKLERKIQPLVKSSKGLASLISTKKVNTDFHEDEEFGYASSPRVTIGGSQDKVSIKISPTEERDLAEGENRLQRKKWGLAQDDFNNIISRNANCEKAWWGLFKANIKASTDEEVPMQVLKAKKKVFDEIGSVLLKEKASTELGYYIIDLFLQAFNIANVSWAQCETLYNFVVDFLDADRIKQLLKVLGNMCAKYVQEGDTKTAETIYEQATKMFIEEVKTETLAFINFYGTELWQYGQYKLATKYFEILAGQKRNSEIYLKLLSSRLGTTDITSKAVKISVPEESEDSSKKKIAELSNGELLERLVIIDKNEREEAATKGYDVFNVVMPCYKVSFPELEQRAEEIRNGLADGKVANLKDDPIKTALIEKIRLGDSSITKKRIETFLKDNNVLRVFHDEWDAEDTCEVFLDEFGLELEFEVVRTDDGGEAITKKQVIDAIRETQGITREEAKDRVEKEGLYKKNYANEKEAIEVCQKLYKLGCDAKVLKTKTEAIKIPPIESPIYVKVLDMVLFQARNNAKAVPALMTILMSAYKHLEENVLLRDITFKVAETFTEESNFKDGEFWYDELLKIDQTDSEAFWGKVKCETKCANDFEIHQKFGGNKSERKQRQLTQLQSYINAKNSATDEQYDRYLRIFATDFAANTAKEKKAKEEFKERKAVGDVGGTSYYLSNLGKGVLKLISTFICLALIYVEVQIFLNPEKVFSAIHYGWVTAIIAVVATGAFLYAFGSVSAAREAYRKKIDKLTTRGLNKAQTSAILIYFIATLMLIVGAVGMYSASQKTYEISNAEEFALIVRAPGAQKGNFVLTEDIDFEGEEMKYFGKTRFFNGTLDGQGHVVKNFVANGKVKPSDFAERRLPQYCYGLFKVIGAEGEIRNLTFENVLINVTNDAYSISTYTGAFAGINGGLVEKCKLVNSYFVMKEGDKYGPYGDIGYARVGGIVGGLAGDMCDYYTILDFKGLTKGKDDTYIVGHGTIYNCSYDNSNRPEGYFDYAIVFEDGIKYKANSIVGTPTCDHTDGSYYYNNVGSDVNHTEVYHTDDVNVFGEEN